MLGWSYFYLSKNLGDQLLNTQNMGLEMAFECHLLSLSGIKDGHPARGEAGSVFSCVCLAVEGVISDVSALLCQSSTSSSPGTVSMAPKRGLSRRDLANRVQIMSDYYCFWLEFFRK